MTNENNTMGPIQMGPIHGYSAGNSFGRKPLGSRLIQSIWSFFSWLFDSKFHDIRIHDINRLFCGIAYSICRIVLILLGILITCFALFFLVIAEDIDITTLTINAQEAERNAEKAMAIATKKANQLDRNSSSSAIQDAKDANDNASEAILANSEAQQQLARAKTQKLFRSFIIISMLFVWPIIFFLIFCIRLFFESEIIMLDWIVETTKAARIYTRLN